MVQGIIGRLASAIGGWFGLGTFRRHSTLEEQMARANRTAARQMDDLIAEARIRMEEAAGWRQPGEQRIGDGIRGSWRSL